MRKILSFVAAFLFAAGMMADPVVLPAVLDVSNVSFRSEGMPDFVLSEGDYAGTYFDMGAHDSSNDTLLYAEWDVTIQPIKYNLAVDVYNTNSWRVQLYLLNQAGDTVKSLRYKGSSGQCGQFAIGSLDLSDLAAGNYKVRARAATAWSAMKLKDVIFQADYQGVTVALPDTLLPAYALLSSGATVANNAIAFAPATANTEYAIWNVSFAEAGTFNVTINMTASNGHTYGVALLSADGQTGIDTVAEAQAWDTGVKELGAITVPAAGNYKVKLTNATQWSEAVINSIVFATPVIGAPAYYLVGSMNNWTPDSAYKFAVNPANENEYMLTKTLAVGDSIKVLEVVGNTTTWYPDQAPNYVVDAAHAGEKTIYFQTTYKADWAEFGGYFWMEANPAPVPMDTVTSTFTKATVPANNAVTDLDSVVTWSIATVIGAGDAPTITVAKNNQIECIKFGEKAASYFKKVTLSTEYFNNYNVTSVKLKVLNNGNKLGKLTVVQGNDTIGTDSKEFGTTWTELVATGKKGQGGNLQVIYEVAQASYWSFIEVTYEAVEPAPEVKYSLKNNWDAAAEWTWKEMTKDGNNYKLENVVFGGTGVNYKSDLLGAPEIWVPVANFLGDVVEAKDTVTFVLNPADSTITATLLGKFEPEPVPGCNWAELPYLGGPAEYANQYKVCKAGEQPGVVNIQKPGFAREYGIYMTFPSAAFDYTSFDTTKCDIQGAGIVFHLSAFTAKVTDIAVVCDNTPILFSVYNENGLVPEVKYSLKNNWGAGEEWTWKEMTKDGDNYKLENVVFGGTGVNYKSDLLGAPELWVPMANFLGDTIAAKDTVTFVLNPADSTITATLLGKYIEPTPVIPMALYKAVAATDTAAGAIYVDNEYMKIQTVYKGTIVEHSANIFDETFTHAIQVRVDNFPTAENPTGTKKDGSTPLVITAKKSAPFILYYVRQAIDKKWTENDNKDVILFDQAAPTTKLVAASMVEDSVLVDSSYYYIGKAFELVEGHTYTLAAKGTTIKLLGFKYPEKPEPVHTYTVAGAPATLFGQEWAPSYAANDMEHLVGSEYLYIWAKDSVTLPAGNIQFKVCEDHAWTHAWPSQNYVLPIAESGIYNIAIYFNPLAEADSLRIRATADKVGSAVVIPAVKMHGNFTGSWADTKEFTLAADSLTASLKLNLAEGNFEFGMKFDGTWKANGANITRTENTACLATGDGNMHIAADQEGEYTFTYTFETQTLAVTYPKIIKHYGVAEAIAAAADSVLVKDDLVYIRGIVTKIEFKGKNFAKYGSACIYVADAAGAADTLEFYNCYSMNADTFKTSDPAYDAESTAWAQFNSVSDANGNTVALGDVVEAFGKYNLYNGVHQLNQGCYITEIHKPSVAPTTAPDAPTQAEEDVLAIYCDYYKTNNLHFGISGWAGAYEILNIDSTMIAYWKAMTWECIIDPANTDAAHDLSGYKKVHVDFWAPAAAKIKFTAEAVAGGNYKDGVVLDLAEGWNSWDIELATWPGQYDFTNLKCFVLEQYQTPAGESFEGNPFAVANLYLYEKKAEGFENIDASVKAVKVLRNGQIFILRGDKVYTVTGQPVK